MLKLAYNMFPIFQNSRSIYAFAPMSGPTVQQLIRSPPYIALYVAETKKADKHVYVHIFAAWLLIDI